MKLVSINIENNLHTKTVLEFLKKERPDIVCMQELLEEDFPFYKKELNLEGVYQPWHCIISPNYPNLKGKKNGVAIFSKNIVDSGFIFYNGRKENIQKSFEEYMSREEFRKNSVLVWADIKDNNSNLILKIVTTHLPVTHEGEVTEYQIKVIDALLAELSRIDEFVLCGDTNAPRGAESFSRIAKKYKDNIPQEYNTSIDQNIHRTKGIQFMVDVLFTTPLYEVTRVRFQDGVSDHMALVAEIERI